ncbi:hypothetical protein HII36_48305 [Nonomuraea sp. NN258]|uniref:hypothetical protein n=1 Tax=Nonomuraea antri TaxID=2730852 RepID=UPI00156A5BD2|nr:hypothetical protein [Nonomuraea antri]NRQ39582.1 hypothetical protein [Nonomuraea antri]
MAEFRPEGSTSRVLAELARLWEQARVHSPGRVTQKELAKISKVPASTLGGWATGAAEPRDLDQLVRVGAALAAWANEPAPSTRDWDRLMLADRARPAPAPAPALDDVGRFGHAATAERGPPGWPLREVTDPFRFGLEVHRAIDLGDAGLPPLPVYVPRAHDRALREVVTAAAGGDSAIALLVGGSSTGKTRACWQALHLLRERPEPWRLWHPIDPTRPEAVLTGIGDVAPYTVVWLNEAQFYLAPDKLGEQVAAGLRELLRDQGRGPVLVLATLWPRHWHTLTVRPGPEQPDPHAQARELLDGCDISVPDAFTPTDLQALSGHAAQDRRLGEAAERTEDGQITQYLAGVPVLLERYTRASPATKALIWAAMDARRLVSWLEVCGHHLCCFM